MQKQYRYRLDPSSKKFFCPQCNKKKFVRYIDFKTNKYIPQVYGCCDSKNKCAYKLNPYVDKYAQRINETEQELYGRVKLQIDNTIVPKLMVNDYNIPQEVLNATLRAYDDNVFLNNLLSRVSFPLEVYDVQKVVQLYYLGTIKKGYRSGAITLPFINYAGMVKAIQVKLFDVSNHTIATDFLHAMLAKHYKKRSIQQPTWLTKYLTNEKKVTCLFGEHLLPKYPNNPVALVEAPKTAIYGTLYFGFPDSPLDYLWLAVYNLSSLNYEKCKALKDRRVYLFPDTSEGGKAYDSWSQKAKSIEKQLGGCTHFTISDYLEVNADSSFKASGGDLADMLIQKDWRDFRNEKMKTRSVNKEKSSNTVLAFVCEAGQLCIKMPFCKEYTVYPCVEAYNQRLCLPVFKPQSWFDLLKVRKVQLINDKVEV